MTIQFEAIPVELELPPVCQIVHVLIGGKLPDILQLRPDGWYSLGMSRGEKVEMGVTHWLRPVVHMPELHPDSVILLNQFFSALAEKMLSSQKKYGWGAEWAKDDWEEQCRQDMLQHIEKGDPRDLAIYAAFMWHHGWRTA